MLFRQLRAARPLASRVPRRAYSPSPKRVLSSRFLQGLSLGVAGGLTFALFGKFAQWAGVQAEPLDEFARADVELQPPTDAPPFPPTVAINKTPFLAVATGVRTVTFLNFHVYAVGLYIADADIAVARKILRAAAAEAGVASAPDFAQLLGTPERGAPVIDELLRAGVRLAVRIVPTRNTDFPHLRDGFVRSVTNHPEAKQLQSPEFGQSIGEIKKAFGRKRKLRKGEVVTWARDVTGGMTAWFGDSDEHKELLGSLPDADVARLFFLQYLTGKKPNSPTLKAHAMAGLAAIAA